MLRHLIILFLGIFLSNTAISKESTVEKLLVSLGAEKLSDKSLPNFELVTLSGDTVTFSHLRGKILILHFWAAWCKPCMKELPELEKFYQQLDGQPVSILGISIDKTKDSLKVLKTVQEIGLSFPIATIYSSEISSVYWT